MSDGTSIEWTDATWNPVRGCARVSPGCVNCYAEGVAVRFSGPGLAYEGLATKRGVDGQPRWTGKIRLLPELLDRPLRWREPRRIFVNSMSDLFHEDVPNEFIDRVWATMLLAPRHTFQVLTKRAERMHTYLTTPGLYDRVLRAADRIRAEQPELAGVGISDPTKHPARWIWLMVSAEDQQRAAERIYWLLKTPAAVRGVSAEPLLGRIDFTEIELPEELALSRTVPAHINALTTHDDEHFWNSHAALDWIIVGGESGPGARPCDVVWVRSIVEQCRAAGVAAFVKQLGAEAIDSSLHDVWCNGGHHYTRPPSDPLIAEAEARPGYSVTVHQLSRLLRSRKGGDMQEWPNDLRVREFPSRARADEGPEERYRSAGDRAQS